VTGRSPDQGEDGYRLWLRYPRLADPARRERARALTAVAFEATSPVRAAARAELARGLGALAGEEVRFGSAGDATLIVGAPAGPDARLGPEGFALGPVAGARPALALRAGGDAGLLYGVFHLLRQLQLGGPLEAVSAPRVGLRMLDHWDNLDGTIERGYAGASLWSWAELPGVVAPRLADYARANASVGINAVALNNVNADARILTAPYLAKVAALADTFRPWAIRVFLSARWSAPIELGGLPTADPADARVAAWWGAKAAEIYAAVPDFGGFLVKANSEGQPGPQDYGRTPTGPTCSPTRSRPTAASSSGAPSSTAPRWPRTGPSRPFASSLRSTAGFAPTCSCR
jgi:alpha-glucuronidase